MDLSQGRVFLSQSGVLNKESSEDSLLSGTASLWPPVVP